MITAAQAAFSFDVTSYHPSVGDQQVQYRIPLGRAFYYLTEEVILNAFRESTARHVASPADIRVVEVPQQEERLQTRSLLELEEEGFINRLPLIGWPVVDTNHNVPFVCLASNSYP